MRLAIYAHYGAKLTVDRHVLHYLQKLSAFGFQICFVSNSCLSSEQEKKLHEHCDRVIQRENLGFDFAMWQDGLRHYDLKTVDELLLTNSSIVGPTSSLESIWKRPELSSFELWGLTDNCDAAHHIQSYFLVFRRTLIQSECFSKFWQSVLPFADKLQVIRSYEIGLSVWVAQHGFRIGAAFPQRDVWRRYLESDADDHNWTWRHHFVRTIWRRAYPSMPVFPHDFFWRGFASEQNLSPRAQTRLERIGLPGIDTTLCYPELLLSLGMPFMKAALLKEENPYMSPDEAFRLLERSGINIEAVEDLRPAQTGRRAQNGKPPPSH